VHADIFSDILQHQRFELADTMLEEGTLKFDNRVGDLENSLLPLENRLDQPPRRTQPFLQILFGLAGNGIVVKYALILVGQA